MFGSSLFGSSLSGSLFGSSISELDPHWLDFSSCSGRPTSAPHSETESCSVAPTEFAGGLFGSGTAWIPARQRATRASVQGRAHVRARRYVSTRKLRPEWICAPVSMHAPSLEARARRYASGRARVHRDNSSRRAQVALPCPHCPCYNSLRLNLGEPVVVRRRGDLGRTI